MAHDGWHIVGKITKGILQRGKTREIPRDSKPAVKPGTKIEGWPMGSGEGRRRRK